MKVSCLMVTQPGREEMAHQALSDFHAQSYPDREIVIVHDDGRPLGELRNESVDRARGDVVCIWDDDDRHGPDRLAVQLAALPGNAATFLDQVTLQCVCGQEVMSETRPYWEPTLMALIDELPRYVDHLESHEDRIIARWLRDNRKVASVHAPGAYVKRHHSNNTISNRLRLKMFRRVGHECEGLKQ